MDKRLTGTSILVADDQMDVVRTLCAPLRAEGADLRMVPDGQAALDHLAAKPADLLIVDLKMPPEEWGGLWLLRRLSDDGVRIPAIVLSGEGWGVREAFRLGATDYIEKSEVEQDLLVRCVETLAKARTDALGRASQELPTPLAFRYAKYESAVDPDQKLLEGLHLLEQILRFGAVVGLSSTEPTPLKGVYLRQLSAISMGTWLDLCVALVGVPSADPIFLRYFSCIMPNKSDRDTVRSLVKLRNDLAHGRPANRTLAPTLEFLLQRFAHRALGLWSAELAIPQTMSYDGKVFQAHYLSLTGAGLPKLATAPVVAPLRTGYPVLLGAGRQPLSLAPWMAVHQDAASGAVRCLQFDGTERTPGPDQSVPLRYAPADGSTDKVKPSLSGSGTWKDLAAWASD